MLAHEPHTKLGMRALCGSDTYVMIFVVLAVAFGLRFNDLDWTSNRAGVNAMNAHVGRCHCAAVAGRVWGDVLTSACVRAAFSLTPIGTAR